MSTAPVTLAPQNDFPTNRRGLCAKGWTAAELLHHPERLTQPLLRDTRTSQLRPATWDEALERIVDAVEHTQQRYGRDAVGCFGGGGLTNEKAYQLGKFARVALRTSAIDYNGRFCMSSAAAASIRSFGIDRGMPFPLADIAQADVILLVGSNPADTLPPAMQFFEEGRPHGAVHIVVDPRLTATARNADLHLQPVPGTDLALANAMLNVAVRERLIDETYIAERTTGFEAVRRVARLYWPDRAERISGVPEADIVNAARLPAGTKRAMILTARGAEQHSSGTDTVQAFINLALALGLPGRPYSGFATITGQGNGQGGRWEIYVGGAAGSHIRTGDLLATVDRHEEVITLTGRSLQYYRENANWLERTYAFVPRVGIDKIRAVVVDDSERIAAGLDARMQKSVDSYRDPWQDGVKPATPGQSARRCR